MAYADIGDVSAGDPVTEAYLDQIRANFIASAPDAFTTKGDLFIATAADAGARLAVGANDSTLVPASGETTGLIWQIQPACRVYNSANIDPTPSTDYTMTFDSERYDLNTMHSTSSNTGRITIPAGGAGIYSIGGSAALDVSGVGTSIDCRLEILLNNATVIAREMRTSYRSNSDDVQICISAHYLLAAADYLTLRVFTDVDVDVLAHSNSSPEFWACWLRMP